MQKSFSISRDILISISQASVRDYNRFVKNNGDDFFSREMLLASLSDNILYNNSSAVLIYLIIVGSQG